MKIVAYIYFLITVLFLSGCGDSIKDAVEKLPVTPKMDLIDLLKKSKLIDSYEIKIMDNDPLHGEVALVIKLKKDAIFSNQTLLKHDKDAYLVILTRFFLYQTMQKDKWSIGNTIIKGQLSTGDMALSKPFFLHPSIFIDLANNERINIDNLENAEGFYMKSNPIINF